MTFHHRAVSCLALFVGIPLLSPVASDAAESAGMTELAESLEQVGAADAAFIRKGGIRKGTNSYTTYAIADGDGSVTDVVVTVKSDAGDEELTLTESNASLHGAASFSTLPGARWNSTLVLLDSDQNTIRSYSGTSSSDGSITLTADSKGTDGSDSSNSDSSTEATSSDKSSTSSNTSSDSAVDIELLAAEVFAVGSGYDVTFDLVGADTYDIASAEFTVVDSGEGSACTKAESGCSDAGSSTTVDVDWDSVGAVWEADLSLEHEGLVDLKIKAQDANGETLDNVKTSLAVPWLDGGEAVNAIGIEDDPLTSLGLVPNERLYALEGTEGAEDHLLVLVSGGWTVGESLPSEAEVELDDGDTLTLPANSYQQAGTSTWRDGMGDALFNMLELSTVVIRNDSGSIDVGATSNWRYLDGSYLKADQGVTSLELSAPVCADGLCMMLVDDDDGGYTLAVTSTSDDPAAQAEDLELTVTLFDSTGAETDSDTLYVSFSDEVTVVFANAIGFTEDPVGLDLTAQVNLLDAADDKGKQKTLAKGKFSASFGTDGDGDLQLDGADKSLKTSSGDAVIAGDASGLSDEDGDVPPPVVILAKGGKGNGYRWNSTSARPELL